MNKGLLYALASAVFLASGIVLNKQLLEVVDHRMLGFAFFASVFISSSIVISFRSPKKLFENFKNHWKDGIIVGGFNATAASFFFWSLDLLDASTTAFVVRFSTVFIIIIGVLFLKEKLTKYDVFGIFFAVGGAFLINYGVDSSGGKAGFFLALIAALGISLHHIAAKIYVKKVGALPLVNIRTFFTASFLFLVTLATGNLKMLPVDTIPFIIIGGGILAVAGFVFFYKALELEDVSKVAVIRTMDPFVVLAYGAIFLGVSPTWREIAGGTLIVAGVVIIILKNRIKKITGYMKSRLSF